MDVLLEYLNNVKTIDSITRGNGLVKHRSNMIDDKNLFISLFRESLTLLVNFFSSLPFPKEDHKIVSLFRNTINIQDRVKTELLLSRGDNQRVLNWRRELEKLINSFPDEYFQKMDESDERYSNRSELQKLLLEILQWADENISVNTTKNTELKLTLREIALLHAYKNQDITVDNDNEIALKYGHKSGRKLRQHYNKFRKQNERTGFYDYEVRKIKNQINYIENVIGFLVGEELDMARNDIQILQSKID